MAEPRVAIVIVHLDSQEALLACLRSCRAIRYENYEVIVIENGSRLALDPDVLKGGAGQPILVIRSQVNLGFSGGSNLGIKAAFDRAADYVLLLNDDTEVAPDFLNVLVQAGEQDPSIGALGPAIYYWNDAKRIWFAGGRFDAGLCQVQTPRSGELDEGAQPAVVESDWLTGCCLLMKRQACEQAGLLDERFFLYWEDTDWSLRLHRAGLRTVTVPSAHIWHKISVSTGGAESALKWYHKTRSHLLFARLHAPHAIGSLLRILARDIAWLLVKSSRRDRFSRARASVSAVKDYYLGRSGRGPDWLWQQC